MRQEVYDIGGMHCAACSSAIERVTRKLPGVQTSEVNLPMNRLTICYDENQCSPERIVEKIEKAGFTASRHIKQEESTPSAREKEGQIGQKASLIVSLCFAAALLFVSMGTMLFPSLPMPDIISMDTHPYNYALLQLLLAAPVLVLGRRYFISGFRSLFHGTPNMDTLVALSASASVLYSLVMTFLLADDPHNVHNLYYESAAVVVALISVGKYLEQRSQEKTRDAITRLLKLTPDTAILVDENGQWEVPTQKLKAGDTVLVKPGARIPLDGTVIRGTGSADESMLTGESLPVDKAPGSEVIGGSVSVSGALYVQVTRTGEDTTLSQIIRFVEDAQGKKAPIAKAVDKVAGVFVPAVLAVAVLAAVIWLLAGAELGFAVKIFTCVLVIACPCAMGLATPTAIIVGTGKGASQGILIRSGEALEIAHKTSVVIFDKTGTLTEGKPQVTDVAADDETALFQAAYALEALSDHPVAAAICSAATDRGVSASPVQALENVPGRGLRGSTPEGDALLGGNEAFMRENQIDTSRLTQELSALQKQGKTVLLFARNGQVLGLLAVADRIRDNAAQAVAALKEMKIKTVLLTGDHRAAAEDIGARAGVDEVVAQVLPTEKAAVVQRYQAQGATVMMVGDGINDAPALVQADVGCAIGNGSDIAIDAADVVLMRSDPMDVSRAVRLSRLTIRNIHQNLFWAFCYNTLGIPIAAGVLYPSLHLLLSPMIGGLAMSLSSLFVVTNALRLRGKKL